MYRAYILLFTMSLGLTACHDVNDYNYLVTHPWALKKAFDKCQSGASHDPECAIVYQAAQDINILIKEQQDDPEQFGQKILDAEFAHVKAKQAYRATKKTLHQNSSGDLKANQAEYQKAKLNYQNSRQFVQTLLGVAALNRPE